VDSDLDAYRELIARGYRKVPVTFVGDDVSATAIIGFDAAALRRALGMPGES
jgi:hypothetical protein